MKILIDSLFIALKNKIQLKGTIFCFYLAWIRTNYFWLLPSIASLNCKNICFRMILLYFSNYIWSLSNTNNLICIFIPAGNWVKAKTIKANPVTGEWLFNGKLFNQIFKELIRSILIIFLHMHDLNEIAKKSKKSL